MEYCGRCGAKVGDDQLFCHKCGGSLVEQRAMNDGATSEQRATSDDTLPEAHAVTYTASTPAWTPAPASAPASVPAPPAPAAPTGGEPIAPAITPSQIIASFTGYKGRVELYPAYLRIVHTGILARSSPNRGVTDIPLAGLTDLTLTPPGRFTMGYLTAIPHDGHPVPRTAQAAINDYLSLPYLHRYRQGAEEFAGTVSEALDNLFSASTPQARPKRVALPRRDIATFTPRTTAAQVATLDPPVPALGVGQGKQRLRRLSGTVWGLMITALLAIVIAAISGGGSGSSTTASRGGTAASDVRPTALPASPKVADQAHGSGGSSPQARTATDTPAEATTMADLLGPTRHATKTYNGPSDVQSSPGADTLLTTADMPSSFIYTLGSPQVNIYAPNDWDAFTSMAAKPDVDSGLSSLSVDEQHLPSTGNVTTLVSQESHRASTADADGPHRRFYPQDGLPGVVYLRLITNQSGYWYAAYDAIFPVGTYVNTLTFLVYIDGNSDHVFGVAGINQYVHMAVERETAQGAESTQISTAIATPDSSGNSASDTSGPPQAITLDNGTRCTWLSGATTSVGNSRANYDCSDGRVIYGDPSVGARPWTAMVWRGPISVTPSSTKQLVKVGIRKVDWSGASGMGAATATPLSTTNGGDGALPTDTPAANAGTGTGPSTGADGGQLASDEGGTGPTAECNDGTTSYSHHPSGTCSHHGGVATWDDHLPHSTP